ncbi:NEDD8-activating enzyme E1 regulatory subunit-like isoform X1 [Biomphalaria glabrata]|uniref:NEDD8-activating enzyme E1 regulatory subunit n=1 Tax=Biomphalaria glabrata TaxID=6526 RepID=A0A9W3AYK1_BIOGL|nr:NEDD8-activating enzyme E1 regulatory subunit-like isoform X1 [Biomphalaria glabrata]
MRRTKGPVLIVYKMAATLNKGTGLDKNNKYDRQLRLWGDHGQAALESSRVCLINASATGTEILKNLVLPGIGSFTIVDSCKVKGEDVGINFFLTVDSIGKSRAQVATELLSELNEDVAGDFLEEDVDDLLEKNPSFFSTFTTVIATQLPEKTLLHLGKVLWERNIPLIVCRCYGFIGYLRMVIKEHTIVESHPDNTHEDLRLDRPFKGLHEFCDSLDLNSMNKKDHSHTPWLVLLYKYLDIWKNMNGGKIPSTYKEKTALKELIKEGVRRNAEGVPDDEENFEEAIRSVNSSLHATAVPAEIQALFEDPCCLNLNTDSKNFWVMVRALKEFTENEGQGLLPLRGSIPDMTSDSERYIQLQTVYRDQAEIDATAVAGHVHALLHNIGREEPLNPDRTKKPGTLSDSEIRTFCRNAAFLTVLRCRSLEEEYTTETANLEELGQHILEEEEDANSDSDDTVLYILLRAADRFFTEYNRYPSYFDDTLDADIPKLKACLSKLLHDWGLTAGVKDDYVHEICRYGASELHTVAAFMGGVAAQEVIKVVTGQFVPINNTFIYNAQKQTSTTIIL